MRSTWVTPEDLLHTGRLCSADRPRMPLRPRCASETDHRPRARPGSLEEIHGKAVVAFTQNRDPGIRDDMALEAAAPRLTCSRAYASPAPVARTVAKLATGVSGPPGNPCAPVTGGNGAIPPGAADGGTHSL